MPNNLHTPSWTADIVQKNVPLAEKTWFRTGGSAQFFAEPSTIHEMSQLLCSATQQTLPITILGSGANILISDTGIPGLVLRPNLTEVSHTILDHQHATVTAGAGVSFHQLIEYSLSNNLLGLEEFSGIPGTVGGSVFINIHYFQWLLSNFLQSATVIERSTGRVEVVDHTWFSFSYNYSTLHLNTHVLANATFLVRQATALETAYARGRHTEMIRHRAQRYPQERTCGSFFRNFHTSEVREMSNGKLMIYIAYYLDKLGVKGQLACGKAVVSHQHANMLVTQEGATSADVIALARALQELVHQKFNIIPQPECQFLGFDKNPLLEPHQI